MKISIIIPVYNNLQLSINCINSIAELSFYKNDLEVIIVDDGSDDGTAIYFTGFEKENNWLIYHRNSSNLKFARSCNEGAKVARGQFIVFLNNDTLVTINWDKILLDTIENDRDTWMVGAKLLYPNSMIQHAGVYLPELTGVSFGHVYNGFPSDFPPANIGKEVQCVTAACMIMRREDFLAIGGFDTGFINGSEDIDLCLRIVDKGKKIVYQPQCEIIHLESKSEGRFDQSSQNSARLFERWKGKVRSDLVDLMEQDLKTCENNGQLILISREKINLQAPVMKFSFAIPSRDLLVGNGLVIGLGCIATEKSIIRLSYSTRSGYSDDKILNQTQPVYKGNNLALFLLKVDLLKDLSSFIVEGGEPGIQITSLSYYVFPYSIKKQTTLTILHQQDTDQENLPAIADEFENNFKGNEIRMTTLESGLSASSLNTAISLSDTEYILVIGNGMKVNPVFPVRAIEILELQPKVGFVIGDITVHDSNTAKLVKPDFNPTTLLSKGKTGIYGLFRKKCWELAGGYHDAHPLLLDTDLFLGILETAIWRGYKINDQAFEIFLGRESFRINYQGERDRIRARHIRYLFREYNKKIAILQKKEEKARATETGEGTESV